MNDGIRLERNRFRPDQGLAAEVVRLEERVVLNSSFKLPPALVGLLPGQSGNLIMTSRAYGAAQSMVIKAFDNFAGTMAKIQKQYGANYLSDPVAIAKIGLFGNGTYGANTALGRLDTALRAAEAKFPYGRGVATDPVNATQLGTGLSVRSAAVSPNASLAVIAADPDYTASGTGTSVSELLDNAFQNVATAATTTKPIDLINNLKKQTLQFKPLAGGTGELGTLPQYLAQFGPVGTGSFSLKNT